MPRFNLSASPSTDCQSASAWKTWRLPASLRAVRTDCVRLSPSQCHFVRRRKDWAAWIAVRKIGARPEDTRSVETYGLNEAYARERAVAQGLVDPQTDEIIDVEEIGDDDGITVVA
jgi:hypothetical protein